MLGSLVRVMVEPAIFYNSFLIILKQQHISTIYEVQNAKYIIIILNSPWVSSIFVLVSPVIRTNPKKRLNPRWLPESPSNNFPNIAPTKNILPTMFPTNLLKAAKTRGKSPSANPWRRRQATKWSRVTSTWAGFHRCAKTKARRTTKILETSSFPSRREGESINNPIWSIPYIIDYFLL